MCSDLQWCSLSVGIAQAIIYLIQAALLAWVLYATLRQVKIANTALIAANKQATIANQTFRWTHRPRIRLKHVWLTSDIWHGQAIEVAVAIVNVGTAPAKIFQWHFSTFILDKDRDLPPPAPDMAPPVTVDKDTLDCGFTSQIERVTDGRGLSHDDHVGIRSEEKVLYCVGRIEYRPIDAEGIHTTAFCLKLYLRPNASVDDRGRFHPHPDPDYEYQD
jgi:hypothetical protein